MLAAGCSARRQRRAGGRAVGRAVGEDNLDYAFRRTSGAVRPGSRRSSARLLTTMSPLLPGGVDTQPTQELYPIYLVLAGVGMLACLGVGMVAARKRRHEHGRLWLPEGFKATETSKKKRREPVGEDSVGLK